MSRYDVIKDLNGTLMCLSRCAENGPKKGSCANLLERALILKCVYHLAIVSRTLKHMSLSLTLCHAS